MKALGMRAWLVLVALSAIACDPSDPCDPGDYEVHGACYTPEMEVPDAGDGDGDAGDGDSEDAGDEEAPPADPYAGFGDECTDDGDCSNGLICGAPMLPMCTQVNCMEEPSICPPDWTCFDTTGLSPDPNITSICLNL